MFFWLLLCCSTIALAMQPVVPRAIWHEKRFARELIGIWNSRLLMVRNSRDFYILQVINLENGNIEQELTLESFSTQWATDSINQNLIILLGNNHVVRFNIFRMLFEATYEPVLPVLSLNFLKGEPVAYVNTEYDQCNLINIGGHPRNPENKYFGTRAAKHIITPEYTHVIDITEDEYIVTDCDDGSQVNFKREERHNICMNHSGSHCIFWNESSIAFLNIRDRELYSANPIAGITALCWSNNSKDFFTAIDRRIYHNNIESTESKLIAEQAPDTIIDLVVSEDDKTLIGLTQNNKCVLWKIEEPRVDGLFSSTIETLKSLYTSWRG